NVYSAMLGAVPLVGSALASATESASEHGVENRAADGVDIDAGRALFSEKAAPACAVCHTLADAGAAGTIGPSLDELQPDAQRVESALRGGVGVMPDYSALLSDDEIALLAQYVEAVTR